MVATLLLLSLGSLTAPAGEVPAERIRGQADFPGLEISRQRELLDSLERSNQYGRFLATYYVPLDAEALSWVSPQLRLKLYRMNAKGSRSNCYWTSHFAHDLVQLPERFMDLPEYLDLLAHHYTQVPTDTVWQPGDVLRLRRARGGMDTHSVLYLGTLAGSPYTHLVISKNGPVDGPYLILDLRDLTNHIYMGSQVKEVYRLSNP